MGLRGETGGLCMIVICIPRVWLFESGYFQNQIYIVLLCLKHCENLSFLSFIVIV